MDFRIKLRKSAGVRVTAEVHRLITIGDRARGTNWSVAAEAYGAALDIDPTLYHIWIQRGHACSEAGAQEVALRAYIEAARLRSKEGEPWLHMGHACKRMNQKARSTRYYLAAASRQGVEVEATTEALRLLAAVTAPDKALIKYIGALISEDGSLPEANQHAEINPKTTLTSAITAAQASGKLSAGTGRILRQAQEILMRLDQESASASEEEVVRPLVFDITDLVGHFRHQRLPTGIQRVQIEVINKALGGPQRALVSICCFIDGRDYWIEIGTAEFLYMARLASSGNAISDPDWQEARSEFFLRLAIGEYFLLPERAILVNLGTSWWIYDYFRMIRNAKQALGIIYVPFVHDFIPIMAPEHCVRGVTEDYVSWVVGVFQHADFFLVNSHATRRDLIRIADRLGHNITEDKIEVVPLDADFRKGITPSPAATLSRWDLQDRPYALFVSTIESRKNHVLAFEAWAKLISAHGDAAVPQLVCVGRNGWLNDLAFERLNALSGLREKVTIINQVSDGELGLLYRSCLFTVYPSHYEGWGLPITESLCYGRVPVIADNSSLPEAGAGFAAIFRSDSSADFALTVASIAFNDERRRAMEEEIEKHFVPRSWNEVADQINAAIFKLGRDSSVSRVVDQHVKLACYYPTHLYREPAIWRGLASGEIFRMGDGWLWPEVKQCRTKQGGGEIRMTLLLPVRQLRLYMRLVGLANMPTNFVIGGGGFDVATGKLGRNEIRWITADLPADLGEEIIVTLRGLNSEEIEMNTGGSVKVQTASIGLAGFALCDCDDEMQRARFIEAVSLGGIDDVSAYTRAA